jgi:hypothetical protein
MGMPSDHVVCFLHIPKNAGSSVRTYVLENERKEHVYFLESRQLQEFAQLTPEEKQRINVVIGHFPFAYHLQEYLPKRCRYSTVLRNPRERVLSLYSYIAGEPTHRLYSAIANGKLGLQDFLTERVSANSENGQVRFLCNIDPEAWGNKPCTTDMLEQSKENLERQFEVVGFCEEMDEFYSDMNAAFKWTYPTVLQHNVTSKRINESEISDKTRDLIDEFNSLDWELYKFAEKLKATRKNQRRVDQTSRKDFRKIPL